MQSCVACRPRVTKTLVPQEQAHISHQPEVQHLNHPEGWGAAEGRSGGGGKGAAQSGERTTGQDYSNSILLHKTVADLFAVVAQRRLLKSLFGVRRHTDGVDGLTFHFK